MGRINSRSTVLTAVACVAAAVMAAVGAAADEPDNLELLVPSEHAVGEAGGAFAAYGYVRATGDFYTGIFGSGSGIRFYDVSEDTSVQYVYPSDQARMSHSDTITNGYFNADWPGGWYVSSLVLNPAPVTYNGVDYDADGLAAMTTMPSQTGGDWSYTRAFVSYDLREIWAETDRLPDYDNAMFSSDPVRYDRDLGYGYGHANWNDVITSLASVQEMADAVGLAEITRSARNGRQAAWSTDGQSVYFVDHGRGNGFGGIWRKDLPTGVLSRILAAECEDDGLYSEPCVVTSTVRNCVGYTVDADQILMGSSATLPNYGGLDFVFDDGSLGTVLPAPRLELFFGQEAKIRSIAADADGNLYLFNQKSPGYGVYLYDTDGRLACLDNRSRRFAWHVANGSTSDAAMSARLQTRETERDPDGTPGTGDEYDLVQVMFMSVNLKGVGGINAFAPADFDRDGEVTAADTAFFVEQYHRTETDTNVLTVADTPEYYAYIKADLNGDAYLDDDETALAGPAVTGRDCERLLRFVNARPGDADLDGDVDAADGDVVNGNLGQTGSWIDGDFNRDEVVDAADVAIWTAHQGETYTVAAASAAASYTGGATGAWDAEVRHADGITPPGADSVCTVNREAGAVVTGPAADTRVGWLAIGNAGPGARTELQLAAGTRFESVDGIHLRRSGGLTGAATVAMGSWSATGTLYVDDGALLGPSVDILGGLYLNLFADQPLANSIGDNGANLGGLILDGSAVLTLGRTNDYTGATRILGGTLRLAASDCVPDASPVDIDLDGTFDLDGFNDTIGPLSGTGTVLLGPGILTIFAPAGATSSWSGVMNGTGTIAKDGPGSFQIGSSASNTFGHASQVVTVLDGSLGISNSEGLGDPANRVVLDGGELMALRSFTLPRTITLAAPDGGALGVAENQTLTFTGALEGAASLAKTGEGTLRVNTAPAFGGSGETFTFAAGRVEVDVDADFGDAANGLVFAGGSIRVRATFATDRAVVVDPEGGEVRIDSGRTFTCTGGITGDGTLRKTSTGILAGSCELGPAGGIVCEGGTLRCDTATTVATSLTIEPAAVLDATPVAAGSLDCGGNELHVAGTVRGEVTGYVLHPGIDAAGTATFENDLPIAGGDTIAWDLRGPFGSAGDPYGWDWIDCAGAVEISATAADPAVVRLRSLDFDGQPGPVDGFDGGTNGTWKISTAVGGVTGFDAAAFVVDATGFANEDALGDWSVQVDGNDLVLAYAAPAPTLILVEPDTVFRWYQAADSVPVEWLSAVIPGGDPIGIELKRDSAPGGIDGIHWYRYAPDTPNDGAQTVAIPATIAAGLDWRFRITHTSGAEDTSTVAFTIGPDGDDDGLPDVWEEEVFETTIAETGDGDADADGSDNATEFYADTDAEDPASYPAIDGVDRAVPDRIMLWWTSSANRVYTVEEAAQPGAGFGTVTNGLGSTTGTIAWTGEVSAVDGHVYRVGIEVDR